MKHHGIAAIAVWIGLRMVLLACAVLGLFLWTFKEWLGGIIWILALFTLLVGIFPTVKDRVPPIAMWASGGFACGGVTWWIITLSYVRG